jgi:hypothetical protein
MCVFCECVAFIAGVRRRVMAVFYKSGAFMVGVWRRSHVCVFCESVAFIVGCDGKSWPYSVKAVLSWWGVAEKPCMCVL